MMTSKKKPIKGNRDVLMMMVWGIVAGIIISSLAVAGSLIHYKMNKTDETSSLTDSPLFALFDFNKQAGARAESRIFNKNLKLTVRAGHDIRPISPLIYGSNLTAKTEFEMDVAKFAKEIGISIFRFPGSSSEGYHWEEGKFDFNQRFDNAPLAKVDNVIKFTEINGTELLLQVNIESGTVKEAVNWVRYMKARGKRVVYWEMGNEVYGDWERNYMTGEQYADIIKRYSVAMKQLDPDIKIVANFGGPNFPVFDEAVMKHAADYFDAVSYHWYPNHVNSHHAYKGSFHPEPKDVMANYLAIPHMIKRIDDMIDKYAPHRKGEIEVTFLEWDGSWDAISSDLDYKYQGIMWSLTNAIFYADALGQFALHGIPLALHYDFQEVMFGLIRGWDRDAGWGGSRWDNETVRPKALALKLFANYFGDVLVESTLEGSPVYYKERDWRADSYEGEVPYVSAYVSRHSDGGKLTMAIINKHAVEDFNVEVNFTDVVPQERGRTWILTGPELEAQNDGSPHKVAIHPFYVDGIKKTFFLKIPPKSVNMVEIRTVDDE